jgi:ribose-phosphate pyrophosphokinase
VKNKAEILWDGLEVSTYPGGEEYVKIGTVVDHSPDRKYRIVARLLNSIDVMRFFLYINAVQESGIRNISVVLPYLPYARQDRVCCIGESLSLKVFAQMLNSFNLNRVEYWDEHSPLTSAYINNGVNLSIDDYLRDDELSWLRDDLTNDNCVLVAPDAGATKRVSEFARSFNLPFVQALKTRNTITGRVEGVKVFSSIDLNDRNICIVDDICDGGRTFIELAKSIRDQYKIKSLSLYVTHGIFSKGLDVFDNLIDYIYTTNSFCEIKETSHPKLTILKGHV